MTINTERPPHRTIFARFIAERDQIVQSYIRQGASPDRATAIYRDMLCMLTPDREPKRDATRVPSALRARVLNALNCCYCGCEFVRARNHPCQPTVDHIEPRCGGGDHAPENLSASCRLCNSRKGARPLAEFRLILEAQ